MKTTALRSKRLHSVREPYRIAMGLALAIALYSQAVAQPLISGLGVMGTDEAGNWTNDSRWHTAGGNIVSFFIVGGENFSGSFINGPSSSQAGVSIPLSFGTHTFTYFLPGGVFNARLGLNIFFNNNNVNPGISVFAPLQTSVPPPFLPFSVNGAPNSQALLGQTVPAANSLTFASGDSLVTLTGFHAAAENVYNLDRVGYVPFGQSFVGSDGRLDRVGQFTIEVVPVPEPGTCVLLVLGVAGLVALRRRSN